MGVSVCTRSGGLTQQQLRAIDLVNATDSGAMLRTEQRPSHRQLKGLKDLVDDQLVETLESAWPIWSGSQRRFRGKPPSQGEGLDMHASHGVALEQLARQEPLHAIWGELVRAWLQTESFEVGIPAPADSVELAEEIEAIPAEFVWALGTVEMDRDDDQYRALWSRSKNNLALRDCVSRINNTVMDSTWKFGGHDWLDTTKLTDNFWLITKAEFLEAFERQLPQSESQRDATITALHRMASGVGDHVIHCKQVYTTQKDFVVAYHRKIPRSNFKPLVNLFKRVTCDPEDKYAGHTSNQYRVEGNQI